VLSNFIQHIPCPKCGSRDNCGEYDDHFWCFGCKYFKPKNDIASVRKRYNQRSSQKIEEDPNDLQLTSDIPSEPLSWLLSYGLSLKEISDNNISWCPSQELLVLINLGTYYQGRCFGNQRTKYLSKGTKPLLFYGYSDKLICVEDILSAIKIARLSPEYCAMPILGSSLSEDSIQKLSGKFNEVIMWLDRDKAKDSITISRNLKQRGFNSRSVITELDPKCYSDREIKEKVVNKLK
jgi:hypothetical protein